MLYRSLFVVMALAALGSSLIADCGVPVYSTKFEEDSLGSPPPDWTGVYQSGTAGSLNIVTGAAAYYSFNNSMQVNADASNHWAIAVPTNPNVQSLGDLTFELKATRSPTLLAHVHDTGLGLWNDTYGCNDCYVFTAVYGGALNVAKIVGGTYVQLSDGTNTSPYASIGSFRIDISGGHLKAYHDFTQISDIIDNTHPTGGIAVMSTGTTAYDEISVWGCGVGVATAAPTGTATPTDVQTQTASPSASSTGSLTASPSPSPTQTSTQTPTTSPTGTLTATPTASQTSLMTAIPSATPGFDCLATDQNADMELGQAGFSVRAAAVAQDRINTGTAMATDGVHFAVVDGYKNRILVWNSYPASDGQPADAVLGQATFTSSNPNQGGPRSGNTLYQPGDVQFDGVYTWVADTYNGRVLRFTGFPTATNASADLVLGRPDFVSTPCSLGQACFSGPNQVWSDGTHLIVSDSFANRVLIYNSLPTGNGQAADLVLGQTSFTGTNANQCTCLIPGAGRMYSPGGIWSDGTRLAVADTGNHRILLWNSFPTVNDQAADVVIGAPNMTTAGAYGFEDVAMHDGNLLATDQANNRVLVYNGWPSANGQAPTRALGQPDLISTAPGNGPNEMTGPMSLLSYGRDLWVGDGSLAGGRAVLFTCPLPITPSLTPTVSSTSTSTPVVVVAHAALVANFENNTANDRTLWDTSAATIYTALDSTGVTTMTEDPWTATSGVAPGPGDPSNFAASIDGTLGPSPSSFAEIILELVAGGGGGASPGAGGGPSVDITPYTTNQGLKFSYKASVANVPYRIALIQSTIFDYGHYMYEFTPTDTLWHTISVYFPGSGSSPAFAQPSFSSFKSFDPTKIGAIAVYPVPTGASHPYGLFIDDITFGADVAPTATSTRTASPTLTVTPSATSTATASATRTITPSITLTPTQSVTATVSATSTQTAIAASTTVVVTHGDGDKRDPGDKDSYVAPDPVRGGPCRVVYRMRGPGKARVRLFQASGDPVGLVEERHESAGVHSCEVSTQKYAPGVYFYRADLQYDDGSQDQLPLKKFIVLKAR